MGGASQGALECSGVAVETLKTGAEEEGIPWAVRLYAREYDVHKEGIHLVVYDPLGDEVVDSVWLDTETPDLVLGR